MIDIKQKTSISWTCYPSNGERSVACCAWSWWRTLVKTVENIIMFYPLSKCPEQGALEYLICVLYIFPW